MSHTNFKRPTSIDPKERQNDRLLKVMASQIADQEMLDKLLEGSDPISRRLMLERLVPYLPFTPKETADCSVCGETVILPHDCSRVD